MLQHKFSPSPQRMQIVFDDGGTKILDGVVAIRCGVDIIEAVKPEPPPMQWVSCRDEPADVQDIAAKIAANGYIYVVFENLTTGKHERRRATHYVSHNGDGLDDLILGDAQESARALYWNVNVPFAYNGGSAMSRAVLEHGYQ